MSSSLLSMISEGTQNPCPSAAARHCAPLGQLLCGSSGSTSQLAEQKSSEPRYLAQTRLLHCALLRKTQVALVEESPVVPLSQSASTSAVSGMEQGSAKSSSQPATKTVTRRRAARGRVRVNT